MKCPECGREVPTVRGRLAGHRDGGKPAPEGKRLPPWCGRAFKAAPVDRRAIVVVEG